MQNSLYKLADKYIPDFLIVGAAKAGTTSLHNYLSKHPSIYFPDLKEPKYFVNKFLNLPQKGKGDDLTFELKTDRRSSSNTDIYTGNSSDYIFFDASHGLRFYTAGAEDMRLEDDGDLHVDKNVIAYSTTISDIRLKENIEPITGALDKVSQLSGYTFNYIADGKKSAGVIAQEVDALGLPGLIQERQNGDLAVQYHKLVPLLIEAVKELSDKVEKIEQKLSDK